MYGEGRGRGEGRVTASGRESERERETVQTQVYLCRGQCAGKVSKLALETATYQRPAGGVMSALKAATHGGAPDTWGVRGLQSLTPPHSPS